MAPSPLSTPTRLADGFGPKEWPYPRRSTWTRVSREIHPRKWFPRFPTREFGDYRSFFYRRHSTPACVCSQRQSGSIYRSFWAGSSAFLGIWKATRCYHDAACARISFLPFISLLRPANYYEKQLPAIDRIPPKTGLRDIFPCWTAREGCRGRSPSAIRSHRELVRYRLLLILAATFVILSPFIYIFLFTWFFARCISRQISQPVQELVEGIRKIRQRDLDFLSEI